MTKTLYKKRVHFYLKDHRHHLVYIVRLCNKNTTLYKSCDKHINFKIIYFPQEILVKAKASYKSTNQDTEGWNEILQILWHHIQIGFKKLEEQLLCATCFYTVLTLTDKHDCFLTQIAEILKSELLIREKFKNRTSSNLTISLMYGMFQSTFFAHEIKDVSSVICVLEFTFNLLISMGYEYSQYTFLAFKVIRSFKKICGNYLETYIFNDENNIKLLNLVTHNWENPVTGVRDLLQDIFTTIINVTDDAMRKSILEEVNGFNWSKAKYLMLSIIVEVDFSNGSLITQLKSNGAWIDGLMVSLHKPGLVSAGADLYYTILKKILSQEQWCEIFLSDVVNILSGISQKAIENFNNYWCLTTLKTFPCLMEIILYNLEANDIDKKLSSILFIMKQGNKLGMLNKCNDNDETKKINCNILTGLKHTDHKIRILAFDIICNRHNKSLPTQIEYVLILDFLHNNLNSDCTVLRLSLLDSLKVFLSQIHIDFLNHMKHCTKTDEENFINFCYKLQKILIDSLNLNGNYQRKITSIKSINLVWTSFSQIAKKKQNNTTLLKYLTEQKVWILTNEYFIQKMVDLLNDPSEDIRENVIKLLHNFYFKDVTPLLDDLCVAAFKSLKSKFFYAIACGQSILKLTTRIIFEEQTAKFKFRDIEDIFYIGYNELITEYKKRDIMYSIENGKQLHSLIGILHVVIEVAILNKYRVNISNSHIELLLNALEDIANQFCWEQESSISSDFSKMNDMVQDIIIKSGYDILNEYDESKISGLHQIVLNCLWLNVKVLSILDIVVFRKSIFI